MPVAYRPPGSFVGSSRAIRYRIPTSPFIAAVAIAIATPSQEGYAYTTGLRTSSKKGGKHFDADQCIVVTADPSHSGAQ